MSRHCARRFLTISLLVVVPVGTAQTPNPGNSPAAAPSTTSTKPAPDSPPLPSDVVVNDPPADTTQNGNPAKRTLKRLAPNCMNGIFHACWSSPPEKPLPPQTDERKGAESREVAEFYYERGNYRAAESRLREAIQYSPHDAKAMFELGQALEKLQRNDDAIAEYRLCIDEQPENPYAKLARQAIKHLESMSKASIQH